MKYNFKSEQEANNFLDQIADPDKIRTFAKQKLGIELPAMQQIVDDHTVYQLDNRTYTKVELTMFNELLKYTHDRDYAQFLLKIDEPEVLQQIDLQALIDAFPKDMMETYQPYVCEKLHCLVDKNVDQKSKTFSELINALKKDSEIKNPVYITWNVQDQVIEVE